MLNGVGVQNTISIKNGRNSTNRFLWGLGNPVIFWTHNKNDFCKNVFKRELYPEVYMQRCLDFGLTEVLSVDVVTHKKIFFKNFCLKRSLL